MKFKCQVLKVNNSLIYINFLRYWRLVLNFMLNLPNLNKSPKDTKIVVAMSGGVDSSVVAALLKEAGYDVVGITLQLYDHGEALKKKGACCAGIDIMDAKQIALKFDFPHYVLNYESLFRENVIDNFVESYIQGETPIPCVKCNQSVKFKDLLELAKALGADGLATGHYVQKKIGKNGSELHRAIDLGKDQSYFLFATTKDQLDFLHFPLGGWTKEETRNQALKLGLQVADKPDSQDICFVPNGDYAAVIAKIRPSAFKKGEIIHINGKILGEHNGIINYTIGQRRGLGISYPDPLFVIKIDAAKNQVIVGPETALQNQKFLIKDVNWLSKEIYNKEFNVSVKLRSAHRGDDAKILLKEDKTAIITMNAPTRAITPGQACVIYDEDRVLGGGWITRYIK